MGRPELEAQALRRQHQLSTPPIPVEDLARRLDVQLSFRPFDGDISGMLFRDDGPTIIGVNSTHIYTRQRFTIAHELGHLLLHKGRQITVDKPGLVNLRDKTSSLATDREEIEANSFAAELLIPKDLIQEECNKLQKKGLLSESDDFIGKLSEIFEVSQSAMEYRLINLGIATPR